ncbi:MAG: corrinoid protein [Ignisphaera sp.]|uniref:Cobalamin-binding protein n=1 Tax=Ignisphaera aggregans TaxID=334771 RepID=A0A7C4NN51_9CREN
MDLRSNDVLNHLFNALVNLESTKQYCEEASNKGISIQEITSIVSKALEIVGKKYEEGEYFLSELIVAGESAKECFEVYENKVQKGEIKFIGRVVVGTVEGDLHDIGKNLFIMFLRSMGFEVIDLGVDVPPQKFIEAVKQYKPDIVGMSALLTTTLPSIEKTIKLLVEHGFRDKVKVIIGGAAVSKEFVEAVGADAGGVDAYEGALICRKWVEEKKNER